MRPHITQYESSIVDQWQRDNSIVVSPASIPNHIKNHVKLLAAESCSPSGDVYWLLSGENAQCSKEVISELLAALIVHRTMPIIYPILHPRKSFPPVISVDVNNNLRETRGMLYGEESLKEIRRIAEVVRQEHAEIVTIVSKTLHGNRPANAVKLSQNHWIVDVNDECAWIEILPDIKVNRSDLGVFSRPDVSSYFISNDYKTEPYLAEATDEELKQLILDVVTNFYELYEDRATIDLFKISNMRWWARFQEALDEAYKRFGKLPSDWVQFITTNWGLNLTDPRNRRAVETARHMSAPDTSNLFKYGSRPYLEKTLHAGEIRINPASFYSDPSLDRARRDDENKLTVDLDLKRVKILLVNEVTGAEEEVNASRVSQTIATGTDYLVWCLSAVASARLFLDFNADACLVIEDVHAFMSRLKNAVSEQLPQWRMICCPVQYYNPMAADAREILPGTHKSMAFEYQQEYRYMWFPERPVSSTKPITVELGSLEDIAKLYAL